MDKPSKSHIAGTFLRCFYATDDGFVAINWQRWTPFGNIYERLFWVWDESMENVVAAYRPDQGRLLLLHAALLLLFDQSRELWKVAESGRLQLKDECIPDTVLLPNHAGEPQKFLVKSNVYHPDRHYHDHYGSIEEEFTSIYNILSKVIWHLE